MLGLLNWKCTECGLRNYDKDSQCIACFTLNPNQCESLHRNEIDDCAHHWIIDLQTKSQTRELAASQLHFSTDPEEVPKKPLLIFGYSRRHSDSAIVDINGLILAFYDEINRWKIDCQSLKKFIESNQNDDVKQSALSKLYPGEVFDIDGVEMKWMLDPQKRDYWVQKDIKLMGLTLCIPGIASGDIVGIKLFISLTCPENWAIFKRHLDIGWFGKQHDAADAACCRYFRMLLNYENYRDFSVYSYIDLLFVKYKDGREYNKDIRMKAKSNISWLIEGQLLQQMKDSFSRQVFHSKLFDSVNYNWCLRLCPRVPRDEDSECALFVTWFKLPVLIKQFAVKLIIRHSITNKKMVRFLQFGNIAPRSEMANEINLFNSSEFERQKYLLLDVELEIQKVNGDDNPSNWEKYGVDID